MAVKSYGFAIGNLRARENSLLRYNDYLQLTSADGVLELASMMREKGIGENLKECSIPEMLSTHTEKLWSYIWDIAPDTCIFAPFLYENDFHNLKAILKAAVKQCDIDGLTIEPASVDVKTISTAIDEKRFDLLPDFLKETAARAYDILTKSGDTQLADGVIDAACINARLSSAQTSKNEIVIALIKTDAFYKNIKVALRCARAKKNAEFINEVLSENGFVPKKDLLTAAISGEEKVVEILSSQTAVGGNEAAQCYENNASEFEKYADNRIMSIAKKCKGITLGVEPLVGYMMAYLTEIKNLRIIYSGIKTGQSEEKIKERLREIYG